MMQSRYLALIVLLLLVLSISWRDKKRTLRAKIKYYGMMFVEGMVGGLIIDSIGVNAGYYYFPRQPLYSLNYWLLVIPCWGVFGLLLNCLWDWLGKDRFIRSMMVSIVPLFIFYEGSNLITGSWIYTAPFYVVVLGWIPLGWVFAGCNKRRRVVYKVEMWKQSCPIPILRYGLQGLKATLIVIMFPLMVVALVKLLLNMVDLIKTHASYDDYKDYTKVMVKTWLAMS